jgi:hypothetical protein
VRRLHRDHWAGLLLMVIGVAAAVASRARPLGTLTAMGAGFFPLALSVLLALLGAAVALAAPLGAAPDVPAESPLAPPSLHESPVVAEWRGWGCIVAGVAAFIGLGYGFGLAPAAFACVFISAFGDRGTRLRGALLLAGAVTAVGVFVFAYLLQLPFPVLQWGPE